MWSIHIVSQEMDGNYCVADVDKLSDSCLCWLSYVHTGTNAWPERGHIFLYRHCVSTRLSWSLSISCSKLCNWSNWLLNFIIRFCTYAGTHCLVFFPQCEHSWNYWHPLTSGSTQSNVQPLHMSYSTCIKKEGNYREMSIKKKHIKRKAVFFIPPVFFCLFTAAVSFLTWTV